MSELLDDALTWWQEALDGETFPTSHVRVYFTGWGKAVKELDAHECFGTMALDSNVIEGCKACEAITEFITAMVGENDE